MKNLLIAYFIGYILFSGTLGLFVWAEYPVKRALKITLWYPIWYLLLVAYIVAGLSRAFIKNKTASRAFKEIELLIEDSSTMKPLRKFITKILED